MSEHSRVTLVSVVLLCTLVCTCAVRAQVAVVPSGGDGDMVAFSVGQVVSGTAVGGSGSAETGVQQTYTVLVQGLEQTSVMQGTTVSVYPNPTSSLLRIDVHSENTERVECRIYTASGQLQESKSFDPQEPADIDMSGYPAGSYTLSLLQGGIVGVSCAVIKK
ncbi:MAG: T9SS type A sorting domain-containing protein [Paludibacteraceae bacterium]|nr:T9SS type A sorting domain-containing protein [Paludibacteraceae bacterium]